jgi:FkbM family methyltransferase
MTDRGATETFRKSLLQTEGFNDLAVTRHGYLLYNRNDTYIGRAIERYGEYGELEANLFRQICHPGDAVVEVGANIGAHTILFVRLVGEQGRVYAYEPQRVVYQTLCANMALNSITNVECFHAAAGAAPGHVKIPEIRYDVEGNFGGVMVESFDTGREVPVVTLDDSLHLDHCRLIKIDAEGMEAQILSGAEQTIGRHRPTLHVENDRLDQSAALIELLWSFDYRLAWHITPLFNPDNFAGDCEDIYPRIVSVNMIGVPKEAGIALNGFPEITSADEHPMKNRGSRGSP